MMYKIKRPAAITGYTTFITGSIALSMPVEYTLILLALFALFIIFHYFTKRRYIKHLFLVFVTAVLTSLYVLLYSTIYTADISKIETNVENHAGYVKSITNTDGTGYIITLLDKNGCEMYDVSVYYQSGFELGDVVNITGKFSENKSNKYIFSNYAKGIKGRVSLSSMELSDRKVNSVKYNALTLRNKLIDNAKELYSRKGFPLVASMGYNEKQYLTSGTKDQFKTAGISHALVVSGFHVAIIAFTLQLFMRFVPFNKKIKNIVVSVFIVGFMCIVGFTPSIIRAGTLAAVILICSDFNIEQDSFTTLALTGMFCIIQNPYITRDIGAMLSYSAAAGMILANEWCGRRDMKKIIKSFICASTAVIFTMPVLALAGMKVTLLSPVFNLLLVFPVSVICALSVVTPILHCITPIAPINAVLVKTNEYFVSLLELFLKFIDKYFDVALVDLGHPVFLIVLLTAVTAYGIVYLQSDNKKLHRIFVAAVSILVFLCYNLLNYNTVTVTAFDSGRETSFHISARGEEYVVLSEWVTKKDLEEQLVSANGTKFKKVYCCFKEFKNYTDYTDVAEEVIEITDNGTFKNETFTLQSEFNKKSKLYTIHLLNCNIQFGHGKVTAQEADYYFLGNDKPQDISADEIYISGNIPSWMNVNDIIPIDSDLTIKINLKTGEHKTVKDVFNFGYQL